MDIIDTRTNNVELTDGVQTAEMYGRINGSTDPAGWAWSEEEIDYIRGINNGWGYDQLQTVWHTPTTQTHNLSVTGGGDKVRYFGAASYVKQEGFLKPLTYDKYNLRMNVTADITKDLEVFAGLALYENYTGNAVFEGAANNYSKLRIWQPDQPIKKLNQMKTEKRIWPLCRKKCTVGMLSLLTLFGCASEHSYQTDYFRVKVNGQGYIVSMQNTTVNPQREFSPADRPSPLLSLYDSEHKQYYYPERASFTDGGRTIRLAYSNGSVATVALQPNDKYLKLSLQSLEPRNGVDAIQWGSYYTNITNLLGEIIGVARDTSDVVNYSIGMLALDDNTLGGTVDTEGDAAPFQYIIHIPDASRFPLPDHLHEGQVFSLGGDGVSDVAFYANKEPYYRIMYGNSALVDSLGRIFLNYQSRDRTHPRQVHYSLIPHMEANVPNHIDVEPLPGVDFIGSSVALWGSPDSTALLDVIQNIVLSEGLPYLRINGRWVKDPAAYAPDVMTSGGRNLYDVDTREWGSTTSQGKDMRDVTYANYFPVSFGATYFLGINQEDVERCPQKEHIFKAIRTWEDARRANAFPRHIRKMLMDPAYDWTLEAGPDGNTWMLYRLVKRKKDQVFVLKRAEGY